MSHSKHAMSSFGHMSSRNTSKHEKICSLHITIYTTKLLLFIFSTHSNAQAVKRQRRLTILFAFNSLCCFIMYVMPQSVVTYIAFYVVPATEISITVRTCMWAIQAVYALVMVIVFLLKPSAIRAKLVQAMPTVLRPMKFNLSSNRVGGATAYTQPAATVF